MRAVLVVGVAVIALAGCGSESPEGPEEGAASNGDLVQVPGVVVQPDSAALSPDGDRIAVPCDGDVCVWTTADGALVDTWDGGRVIAWSPDGDHVATTSITGERASVVLLDASSGAELTTFDAHAAPVTQDAPGGGIAALSFSADGALLASAGDDGIVKLWSLPDGQDAGELDVACETPRTLAFAPTGDSLAIGCGDAAAEIWDVRGSEQLGTLDAEPQAGLAWSPDAAVLATASHAPGPDATVRLWNATDLSAAGQPADPVEADRLAFAPDGARLAMSVKDETEVRVWTVATEETLRLAGASDPPRAVLWSADGDTVYAVSGRDGVLAWDVESGKLRKFEKPTQ